MDLEVVDAGGEGGAELEGVVGGVDLVIGVLDAAAGGVGEGEADVLAFKALETEVGGAALTWVGVEGHGLGAEVEVADFGPLLETVVVVQADAVGVEAAQGCQVCPVIKGAGGGWDLA